MERGLKLPFEEEFAKSRDQLWTLALRLSGYRREDAEDMLSEASYRAIQNYHKIGEEDGALLRWMSRVMSNLAIDGARKRKRRGDTSPLDEGSVNKREGPSFDDVVIEQIYAEITLLLLSEECLAAFHLTQIIGMTYSEAAAQLHLTIDVVKARVYRGREIIKLCLNENPSCGLEQKI